jgi:putative oxidoreductase
MRALVSLHNSVFGALEAAAPWLIPTLARLVFAGTLLIYFWNSGLTKWGAGPFSPDLGAYIQILPRAFDAVGYDPSALGPLATATVLFGTWAEFILPALVVLGLFTRIAALGMIGFVIVLTWVDIMGHGAGPETIGAWFNNTSGDAILDQRAFWIFLLIVLVLRGGGPAVARRAPLAALQQRRLHRRVPAEVKPPSPVSITGRFISAGCAARRSRGGCARRLRQPAPGRGPRVHHPVPEGPEEPRPRGVVQRRSRGHPRAPGYAPRRPGSESPSGRYRSCATRRP